MSFNDDDDDDVANSQFTHLHLKSVQYQAMMCFHDLHLQVGFSNFSYFLFADYDLKRHHLILLYTHIDSHQLLKSCSYHHCFSSFSSYLSSFSFWRLNSKLSNLSCQHCQFLFTHPDQQGIWHHPNLVVYHFA